MLVKAAPGLQVPKENKPREYITEANAVEVPGSAYYMRRLACGDLVLAEQPAKKTGAKPTTGEE
jgi:hypothetical protein